MNLEKLPFFPFSKPIQLKRDEFYTKMDMASLFMKDHQIQSLDIIAC